VRVAAETPLDAEQILRALADHRVDYVIVGGLAVQAHGHLRTTVDIDVLPRPESANLGRLADALNSLDARILNPGSEPLEIDAATLRRGVKLGDLQLAVAGRDDLIGMKRASARRVDLEDIAALTELESGGG
jgi:hypothetical protein